MKIGEHFSDVASIYKNIRTTDIEPVLYIGKILSNIQNLKIADVGCGDGRYDELFLKHLSNIEILYCIYTNEYMLNSLKNFFL